jgi:hypothetical protein
MGDHVIQDMPNVGTGINDSHLLTRRTRTKSDDPERLNLSCGDYFKALESASIEVTSCTPKTLS